MLSIKDLSVSTDQKQIIKNFSLTIKAGEVHALLGPNGSGKSSLALALMGHPDYKIQDKKSSIQLNKINILNLSPDQRAKAGLFLAFQNPLSLDGIQVMHYLRTIFKNLYPTDDMALFEFRNLVEKEAKRVGLKPELLSRNVNVGFSGGERKRFEILQLRLFKPKVAIIDEIDSGLDVDGLKAVALAITTSIKETAMSCLVITHHQKLLKYLNPHMIHVMVEGKIIASGGEKILEEIENKGYKKFTMSSGNPLFSMT